MNRLKRFREMFSIRKDTYLIANVQNFRVTQNLAVDNPLLIFFFLNVLLGKEFIWTIVPLCKVRERTCIHVVIDYCEHIVVSVL